MLQHPWLRTDPQSTWSDHGGASVAMAEFSRFRAYTPNVGVTPKPMGYICAIPVFCTDATHTPILTNFYVNNVTNMKLYKPFSIFEMKYYFLFLFYILINIKGLDKQSKLIIPMVILTES
jgi:hypothetical protein